MASGGIVADAAANVARLQSVLRPGSETDPV